MSDLAQLTRDPGFHRHLEQLLLEHVQRLLDDDRLRVDTKLGRRPITSFIRDVSRTDKAIDLKRMMSEMNLPDRELERRMPVGEMVEVTLSKKSFWLLRTTVGKLRVVCVSPTRSLLRGDEPKPLTTTEVNKLLSQLPPVPAGVPTTIAVMSTTGFTMEAHELAERRADRTVIMIEPNASGGWTISGPLETKALSDLFDPESEEQKYARVRDEIEAGKQDLIGTGIASDRMAARTQLPIQIIEAELKRYAQNTPGLVAKRLDGRVVLFQERAVTDNSTTGAPMSFWQTVKGILHREQDPTEKISKLAEQRVILSQQRSQIYDVLAGEERKEKDLVTQFPTATVLTQQRIAADIAQIRTGIERYHQLLATIDRKLNIISVGIHNLELEKHVTPDQLKGMEVASRSTEALERGLAALEEMDESAEAVSSVGVSKVPDRVQQVLDELRGSASNTTARDPIANTFPASSKTSPAIEQPVATMGNPTPQAEKRSSQTEKRLNAEPG